MIPSGVGAVMAPGPTTWVASLSMYALSCSPSGNSMCRKPANFSTSHHSRRKNLRQPTQPRGSDCIRYVASALPTSMLFLASDS